MTTEEALIFFKSNFSLKEKLNILNEVGLGYIQLGQPAPSLSGGEAQRVKLATELSRKSTGKTIYILDEPTTGLHPADIKNLLNVLKKLVDKGNTVLVIEHNLDIIKNADWIIDLGPEGGDEGGYIVIEGAPEKVAKMKKSYTGQWLRK
jgi:excinuclease ABC subunit A